MDLSEKDFEVKHRFAGHLARLELPVPCATDFSLCVGKFLLPALPVIELYLFLVLVLSKNLARQQAKAAADRVFWSVASKKYVEHRGGTSGGSGCRPLARCEASKVLNE